LKISDFTATGQRLGPV